MRVFKSFYIDVAHSLPAFPDLHGHSYRITIWIDGPLQSDGCVLAEDQFAGMIELLKNEIDHKNLDTIVMPPTSEQIASFIASRVDDLIFVPWLKLSKVCVYRDSCQFGVELER